MDEVKPPRFDVPVILTGIVYIEPDIRGYICRLYGGEIDPLNIKIRVLISHVDGPFSGPTTDVKNLEFFLWVERSEVMAIVQDVGEYFMLQIKAVIFVSVVGIIVGCNCKNLLIM